MYYIYNFVTRTYNLSENSEKSACEFVRLFVCVSALRHPYMSSKVTQVRIFRYHAALNTRWFSFSKFFLDRKFMVRTIHHVFSFSWKYSSRPWRFQWPVSRKAVLFHEFISAVNSTNYSSYRVELDNHPDNVLVQGDNMYFNLNAFNNDLIPHEGFLALNNFIYQPLFVVDRFCACLCR